MATKDSFQNKFDTQTKANEAEKAQDFSLSNAREQLQKTSGTKQELLRDKLASFPTKSGVVANTIQSAVVPGMVASQIKERVASGDSSVVSDEEYQSMTRDAYMQGNKFSGAEKEFNTSLAPHLTSGQQSYLYEKRLAGDSPQHTGAAYNQMRDELGIKDENGQIMRNPENGEAILSQADKSDFAAIKGLLDRNVNTNLSSAKYDAMSVDQYNAARFNKM